MDKMQVITLEHHSSDKGAVISVNSNKNTKFEFFGIMRGVVVVGEPFAQVK